MKLGYANASARSGAFTARLGQSPRQWLEQEAEEAKKTEASTAEMAASVAGQEQAA